MQHLTIVATYAMIVLAMAKVGPENRAQKFFEKTRKNVGQTL